MTKEKNSVLVLSFSYELYFSIISRILSNKFNNHQWQLKSVDERLMGNCVIDYRIDYRIDYTIVRIDYTIITG